MKQKNRRIREGKTFGKYIPDFEYYLVPLRDYSNEALMARRDEISLVMIVNKLQTAEDIEDFRRLPAEEIETILKDSPAHLVNVVADVLKVFLLKMNVPVPETEKLTDKVREKKMGELFADMEKMDIQAERRNTAKEKKRADRAERRADRADKRADEERERANRADKRADEEKERADRADKQAVEALSRAAIAEENEIKSIIEVCQELGASKDSAIERLMVKKSLSLEVSLEKTAVYWKA